MRICAFKKVNINSNKLRILNIYNLAQKLNHRIYNLSLGKKFTNGFIRNGHDVIEISDRDYVRQNKGLNLFNMNNLIINCGNINLCYSQHITNFVKYRIKYYE